MRPESVFSETKRVTWFFVLMVVATVLATLLGGRWLAMQTERDLHIQFLDQVELTAQSLPGHELLALEGAPADTNKAIYARLKTQLEIVQRSLLDCRFVYILGQNKDGKLFFFVDGEPASSHDAVFPGQPYEEAAPAFNEVFEYWTPRVVGPYEDRWGSWVSALVPLPVTRNDGVKLLFGVDKDSRLWKQEVDRNAILPAVGFCLLVLIVLAAGAILLYLRKKAGDAHPRWMLHVEVMITLALGLTLTATVAWLAHRTESRNRHQVLAYWAHSRVLTLSKALHDLLCLELEGVAQFFEGSEEVTQEEFQQYTHHLLNNRSVQAWGWIPVVQGDLKETFETKQRDQGLAQFKIWEFGASGSTTSAAYREYYYPITFVEPWTNNNVVVGFDAGSEPNRLRALEEAVKTGLPTGVVVPKLAFEHAQQPGMVLYRPVFEKTPERPLQGFAFAALKLENFLNQVISDRLVPMQWRHLSQAGATRLLAATPPDFVPEAGCSAMTWRFCAAGQVFEATTFPSKTFERLYPVRAGPRMTVAGLTLTVAVAAVVFLLRQREERLETLVRQRTAALQESEETFRKLFEDSPDPIALIKDGKFAACNRAVLTALGIDNKEKIIGTSPYDWAPEKQPDGRDSAQAAQDFMAQAMKEGMCRFEWLGRHFQGHPVYLDVSLMPIQLKGETLLYSTWRDITERKHAEEVRDRLQAQLLQAQKMESVGRLAGGVAHDFNNMLNVILGHTELLMEDLGPHHPAHADLVEIQHAAERSARLTRQLLGFARKQTIAPEVLDLNQALERMLKMLQRLIGEDIQLVFSPGADVYPVELDPTQLDQILANLCVNARDAIQGVGKIIIETRNVAVDEDTAARHENCVPGDYLMISVSDTGCGMDAETLGKIFEPFFTTKEVGKGTGLGLAMVYGVMRQNRGFITVESQPGKGSTFRLYFPAYQTATTEANSSAPAATAAPQKGHETILLVEDDSANRAMTKTMLERLGYRVLSAGDPEEALKLAEVNGEKIELLLTDVIMPQMNGRELFERLSARHSHLRCLYISGYSENVVAERGELKEGVHLVSKPFTLRVLALKLREALEGKPAS